MGSLLLLPGLVAKCFAWADGPPDTRQGACHLVLDRCQV